MNDDLTAIAADDDQCLVFLPAGDTSTTPPKCMKGSHDGRPCRAEGIILDPLGE